MTKKRDINLDLLKVIACFAVVGLHTLKSDVSICNSILYYLCGFAIPVFFMSSGLILVNRPSITWEHTWKKCLRIFVIAMIWGAALEAASFLYHLLVKKRMDPPLDHILHAFGNFVQKGTMFHFWYLGALMIVYLIVYVLFKTGLIKKKSVIWCIVFGASVLMQLLDYVMGICIQKNVIQTFRQWTFMQYFLLGGALPAWMPSIKQKIPVGIHAGGLVIVSCLIPVYQLAMKDRLGDPHAEFFYDDILMILWAVILFTFVMRLPLNKKTEELVSFLAPMIMGIYIIHVLVIKVIVHFMPLDSFGKSLIAWLGVLIISALVTCVISKIPVVNKLVKI